MVILLGIRGLLKQFLAIRLGLPQFQQARVIIKILSSILSPCPVSQHGLPTFLPKVTGEPVVVATMFPLVHG